MNKVILTFALTLAATTSFAAQSDVGYGGSVGALALATRGVATNADEVRTQRGYATAGAVHWIQVPETRRK